MKQQQESFHGEPAPRPLLSVMLAMLGVAAAACQPDREADGIDPSEMSAVPSSGLAADSAAPSEHLGLGVPVRTRPLAHGPDEDLLMLKPQYALSYNRARNGANWVGWRVDASEFGAAPRHRGRFLADSTLPEGWSRVTHDDYTGSGYDRGHMVRSEERTRSVDDNRATFLLTNVLPQRHDLNAGPWLRLEERCQALAQDEKKTLHVIAGGLFNDRLETIGRGVAVPEAFFKIVVVLERGQTARDVTRATPVIAVIMPNDSGILGESWRGYRTTIDEIEWRSGYDFLTDVPAAVERVIEARVDRSPVDGS